MVTDKQLSANQKNARLGGVKTEPGKAVSKYNAQKHAILRQSVTDYEDAIHQELIEDLEDTYKPVGRMELILVERIAMHYIKLFRIQKAETEMIKSIFDPRKERVEGGYKVEIHPVGGTWEPTRVVVENEGYTPRLHSGNIERIADVFGRYETTVENKLYKALHELERLQRLRKGDNVAAPFALDIAMGSFSESEAKNE